MFRFPNTRSRLEVTRVSGNTAGVGTALPRTARTKWALHEACAPDVESVQVA